MERGLDVCQRFTSKWRPMDPLLGAWSNFYVVTGSSAASLTGLMFIVITLVAGQERHLANMRDGVETFSSPTVVHFCAALLISATLAAPWHSLTSPGIMLALTGLGGLVYALRVPLRMKRRTSYQPEFEDWMWFAVLPVVSYLAILAAALALSTFPTPSLFALAGGTIALIFTGIRNAWDVVTFIAVENKDEERAPKAE
jgi:hypothetical protein